MFKFGLSIGRNNLTLKGHVQTGYVSKAIKNYRVSQNNELSLKFKRIRTQT